MRSGLHFTLTAALLLSACAGGDDYIIIGSARVPSTVGLLTVDTDDDASELELSMEFLPPPKALSHRFTHYVAWILPTQGQALRLGALHYVARDRTASLVAESIPAPYTVIITVESNAAPEKPGDDVVADAPVTAN